MAKFFINDSEMIVGDFLRLDGTKKMEGELVIDSSNLTYPYTYQLGTRDVTTDTAVYWGATETNGACLRMNGPDKDSYAGVIGHWVYKADGTRKDFNIWPKDTSKYPRATVTYYNKFLARKVASTVGPVYSDNGCLLALKPLYLHRIWGIGGTDATKSYCFEVLSDDGAEKSTAADIAKMIYNRGYTSGTKMVPGSGGYFDTLTNNWFVRGFFSTDGSTLKVGLIKNESGEAVASVTWTDKVTRVR